MLRYHIMLTLSILIIGCQSSKKYDIEIREYERIGNNKDLMFSFINDIDLHRNYFYVMDSDLKRLYKIDTTDFSKHKYIQFSKGKGPGEFTYHPGPFVVVEDSMLVVLDELGREIEFFTLQGKPLFSKKLDFMPHDIFTYRDNIYVSGNSSDNIIYVYDYNGNLVRSFIKPFLASGISINWFPEVLMEKNFFYITNPYKTSIIKWDRMIKWEFFYNEEELITKPQELKRGKMVALYQTSGWATNGLFLKNNFLYVSTFSVSKAKKKVKPQLFVLDTNSGRMIVKKPLDKPFLAKSLNNGQYIFAIMSEPFPSIVRIDILLKEL